MEQALARQHTRAKPVNVCTEGTAETLQELYEMIARRAYELFVARGCKPGRDLEDWLRAQAELLQPIRAKIRHTVNRITVRAELPGFRADEIRVNVEPWHMILITDNRSSESDKTGERAEHIFHVLSLPAEIEPSGVTAALEGGVLEVILPKVEKFEANLKLKAA